MWVAAAPCRGFAVLVGVLASAFSVASAEPAVAALPTAPSALPQIWAVELSRENARLLTLRELRRSRAAGINAVVIGPNAGQAAKSRTRRNAKRIGLLVFAPLVQKPGARRVTAAAAASACGSRKAGEPGSRCAVLARSPASARLLAIDPAVDIVFVRVARPARLATLLPAEGRVVALAPLTAGRGFVRAPWRRAIALARKSTLLDLAVKPSGTSRRVALHGYARLLSRTTSAGDTRSPTPPSKLKVTGVAQTEIAVSWSASKDKSGIASYGLYVHGRWVGSSAVTSAVFSDLPCGATSLLEVDAVDPAGNRSRKTALQASTETCGVSVATSTPANGATVAGAITWEAAVTGGTVVEVRFLIDGDERWTEKNPPYLYGGDADGWDTRLETNGTHTLTLVAYLETGDTFASSTSVTVANAGSGSDTSPPSAPTGLRVTATGTTSVSIAWDASADDVGVAGYGVYSGETSAGSTPSTAYVVGGLTCDTTYSLAVDAFDAAGNRSARSPLTAATGPCDPPEEGDIVFVSTGGSDTNGCTQAAPCKTFDRAYRVADPGDVVEVAGGTYPGQTINLDTAKTASDVVLFRPPAGAAVTLSSPLTVYGRHLELRDMTFRYEIQAGASDVTLRNIVAPGRIRIASNGTAFPKDISIIGGEIGPGVDSHPQIGSNGTSTSASPTNILFDGVRFHDFTISAGSGAHVECLQVWAVDGLTIRNSRFENCYYFDILIQKLPGGSAATPANILIENNFLDCCGGGYYSILLSDTYGESWRNVVVRNNSSNKAMGIGANASYSNVDFLSNIAPKLDGVPKAGVTVDHNVWYGGTRIGPNDQVAAPGFRDAGNLDFHLAPGAAAIDRGHPADHPFDDIDGQLRPLGAAADVGADEADGVVDTEAPTTPTGLIVASAGATTLSFAWNPASDNVGVVAYELYRNGVSVGSTAGTSYTLAGLTCGQSYAFEVEATDAAGNRSGMASVNGSTECSPPSPPPPAPAAGKAHVWVDTNGGACTRSSTPGEYADAAACPSFSAAYTVALCGDVVHVKAGAYGGQLLSYSPSKADTCKGQPVVIEAADGEVVTLSDDTVDNKTLQLGRESALGPRDILFRDLILADEFYMYPGTRRITIEGFTAHKFFIRCGHDVTLRGNTWTDPKATGVPTISSAWTIGIPPGASDVCADSSVPSSRIMIENDYFFRIWRPNGDSSSHRECLHVMGADGLTIRNSRFHECLGNTAAISLNIHGGSVVQNIVIEGNSFWRTYDGGAYPQPTGEGPAINIGGGAAGEQEVEVLIRFNTWYQSGTVTPLADPTGDGIVLDANLFLRSVPSCSGQLQSYTWRYNVAESGTWGASCDDGGNAVGSTSVEDRANGDLRLRSGSFAVGKGNPAAPPLQDVFGTVRPQGAAPDAGFHEKE